MKFIIPCLTSFLLTAAITPLVIRLATACNCVDLPGGRRLHEKPTPRWGGVAFFAGVLPFLFMNNGNGTLTSYIVASSLLVGMGMVDDLRSLGWKTKFSGMAAAATIVIFGGDITVHQLGTYGSLGRIELGWLSIPFTFLSIIGITNAINLLDGLNGLAGGVSLLGFLFMGIAALLAGNVVIALVCFAFVGALAAFLLYNFPNARVFMGDAGSIFLGFSLSVTAVSLTQGTNSSVEAMFPVLVLLLPIFDTVRVLIVRLLNGRNPFKADHLHLHYLIVEKQISPVTVVLMFWFMTLLFGGIGLTMAAQASAQYLVIVLYTSALLTIFAVSLTPTRSREEGDLKIQRPISPDAGQVGPPRYLSPGTSSARKGGMVTIKWMVGMGIVLLAGQIGAAEAPQPKTEQNKAPMGTTEMINYSVGYQIGGDFKAQGVELNPELLVQGIRDALNKTAPLVSQDEMNTTLGNLKKKITATQLTQDKQAAAENRRAGAAFLAENAQKEGVTVLPSGVQYKIIRAGAGKKPTLKDDVRVHYRITRVDGKEVGSTYVGGKPRTYPLAKAIPGLQEVLPLMSEGAKWQIVLPGGAPAGSRDPLDDMGVMIYEMELLSVLPAKTTKDGNS